MCTCHSDLFIKRRKAFLEAVTARASDGDAVCVFPAAPVFTRNNDVEHDYRQDSDLFYLTGWNEPGTVLVMGGTSDGNGGKPTYQSTFFVRPRDPDRSSRCRRWS